jgi:hypothetical protein
MNRLLVIGLIPTLLLVAIAGAVAYTKADAAPRQAHSVFFTLKDSSPEARAEFVKSCQKYLTGHEGAVSVSFGTIAGDVVEPDVSVRDFDVSLLVVFENKEAGQKYLVSPRHKEFVEKNKEKFAKVRVFDSYLAAE